MTTLHAQLYDISANGFYFETAAEYNEKARKLVNSYGQPVEKFELQFIDGEASTQIYSRRLAFIRVTFQPIWKPLTTGAKTKKSKSSLP
jgi:hypothetical protein